MPTDFPSDAAGQPDDASRRAIDWGAVYDEHSPRVRRIIERRAGTDVADDLLQETFARALRGATGFDVDRPIAPWLNTIAFHVTSDRRRQPSYGVEVLVDQDPEVVGPDQAEDSYTASVRRMGIRLAFASLNPRHRRVLQLIAVEGMTHEQVAEFEHMSLEAVKSVLARARMNFRATYSAFVERMGLLAGFGVLGPAVMRLRARLQRAADLAVNHAGAITVAAVTTAVVGVATLPATTPTSTRATESTTSPATTPRTAASPADASSQPPPQDPGALPPPGAITNRDTTIARAAGQSVDIRVETAATRTRDTGSVMTNAGESGTTGARTWGDVTITECDATVTTTVACAAIGVAAGVPSD